MKWHKKWQRSGIVSRIKKAVVDIDGILWLMGPPWWEVIKKIAPDCPCPGTTGEWDFYKGYLTDEEMAATVLEVHMNQHKYHGFESAHRLTKSLQRNGYYVTIASHRDPRSRESTIKWLEKRGIPYDDLYTGFDKHFLLDDAEVFVDDSPLSQKIAVDKGVTVFSIEYGYNKHVEGVRFSPDFFNMCQDITNWFRGDVGRQPNTAMLK